MADEVLVPKNVLAGAIEKGEFLLMVSPTVWADSPLGGIHILQAACREAGVATSVLYTNLLYLDLLGEELHKAIAMEDEFLLEERLFAATAFDLPPMGRNFRKYFDTGKLQDHIWPSKYQMPTEMLSEVMSPFIEVFRRVNWEDLEKKTHRWCVDLARQIAKTGYKIIGCSTTHGGLASAVAMLNKIKNTDPSIVTVIGGALCEAEMAEGIGALKTGIDYVFSGEGELTFPTFAKDILNGRVHTETTKTKSTATILYGEPLQDLNSSPFPDYSEFMRQMEKFSPDSNTDSAKSKKVVIPYETSRGCWYGKCTFCGLMGKDNAYRRKSPDKALEELKRLSNTYSLDAIFMTDNIIPPEYYRRLFPQLSTELSSLNLHFEIKANLSLNQLQALQKAGTTMLQPGIESLSASLLRRMDKGVTVQENLSLLRYARSLNLDLKWNLLFGFPGDRLDEYEEMLGLLPLISHLQPPRMMIPIRLCRFSRYQTFPESFDISNLRPATVHSEILPSDADVDKLSVLFTGDYPSAVFENQSLLETLHKAYENWRDKWSIYSILPIGTLLPELHISRESNDRYQLRDTRGIPGRPENSVLNNEEARLLSTSRPWEDSPKMNWALNESLAIKIESRFIPLVTMSPNLTQDFLP
jgi:ribosomal peptide maturation radical SAM protein 1